MSLLMTINTPAIEGIRKSSFEADFQRGKTGDINCQYQGSGLVRLN